MSALTDITALDVYRTRPLPIGYPSNVRQFWAPQDDVHGTLKALISSCQRSLIIAMYGYDDDELAGLVSGLLDKPDVYCQITLDKSQAGGVHERELLKTYKHEMTGNSVAIGTSEHSAIMHRKVCIVDGVWFVGGSTNWSLSGEQKQDNQLDVIQDPVVCTEARTVLDIEHDHALAQMASRRPLIDTRENT